MRLGQLARKYDVPLQDIISYLEDTITPSETLHANSRLDEETEASIIAQFGLVEEALYSPQAESVEPTIEVTESEPVEIEVVEIPEEIEPEVVPVISESEEPTEIADNQIDEPVQETIAETPKLEVASIDSDRLLELIESEDTSVDLSKITLIKAPKKELEGLKVLGKIELPEPKIKQDEKSEPREKGAKNGRNGGEQRPRVNAQELEERRLWAKKKKEENEVRLERKRKEQEKEQLKTLKAAHYKQKLQRTSVQQPRRVESKQVPNTPKNVQETLPKPTTVLGKFWRWLNT